MCGLAGLIRISAAPLPDPSVVRRMMGALEHRGPDDSGEYRDDEVHIGFTRLAIIDLKNGNQPVHGCRHGYVTAFNGEIYNYQDLRAQLRRSGHKMRSEGDGEVITHLFEEFGLAAIEHLRGMFAIAAWDSVGRQLHLVRDRLGIKPLYWVTTDRYLLFASEAKALFQSGLVQPEIDTQGLDDLFSLSYPCPPRTMFKGVLALQPGRTLTVPAGSHNFSENRYWRPPVPRKGEHSRLSRSDAAEHLRELLNQVTYEHLQSDVPLACYLSGGLDSSAIAAIAKEVTGDAPRCFSIGFSSAEHDESADAIQVASALGAELDVVNCGPHLASELPEMIRSVEMPLQFPLALPMRRLSGAISSRGYRVALTGEGADEIFGGYDCFRSDKLRRTFDHPLLRVGRRPAYSRLYRWLGTPEGTVDGLIKNHENAAQIMASFGGIYPPWFDVWFALSLDRERLLSTSGRRVRPLLEPPAEFSELLPKDPSSLDPLDAGIALELETRLPAWILQIGDRSSMANGVEARVPFLDHRVVEFVLSLPPTQKMPRTTEKALLRRAVRDLLPREAVRRRKRPFYTPLSEWFFPTRDAPLVSRYLNPDAIRSAGLFQRSVVDEYLSQLLVADRNSLRFKQLEWNLTLILSTQILSDQFVSELPS